MPFSINLGFETPDLSDSMRKNIRSAFSNANLVIDRFHIPKLTPEAVQELHIKHRWDAIHQANDEKENDKLENREYVPFRYANGDTRKELLMRSRYLLSSLQTIGLKDRQHVPPYCSMDTLT